MFKRTQQDVSDSSKHWYQDKYQNVLSQRNVLALVAVVSLAVAGMAVLAVMRLAPLKSVQPYLLQIDEKTGITQRVNPVERDEYSAYESVDRYFTAQYLRLREGYNRGTIVQSYETVRLMSGKDVFDRYRPTVDASVEGSITQRLGASGQRDVKIRSMAYIPGTPGSKSRIIRALITTIENAPDRANKTEFWEVTITFEYAILDLNQEGQWLNPLGYTVTSYQINPEIE